jgi:hypothetical protein
VLWVGDVVEFLHFSLIVGIVLIVRIAPFVELLEVLEEGRGPLGRKVNGIDSGGGDVVKLVK